MGVRAKNVPPSVFIVVCIDFEGEVERELSTLRENAMGWGRPMSAYDEAGDDLDDEYISESDMLVGMTIW